MRNTAALALRILQQFRHDPRTVVMFIVAPILVLWLFSVLLGATSYRPILAGVGLPTEVGAELARQDASYESLDADEAARRLKARTVDAVLTLSEGVLHVDVEGSDAARTTDVSVVISAAVKDIAANQQAQMLAEVEDIIAQAKASPNAGAVALAQEPLIADVKVDYLHGNQEWSSFDYFGPVFIGIFVFVFVFLTSGMSLITERTGGTLERLLTTPIKPWQFVLGFSAGFGIVSLVQAVIVLWACITLVGFPNEGSLGTVITVTFSLALVSLTLGLAVSGLARTPFQVIQLMLLTVVPQILLSGIFDLTQTPNWMQALSACLPITHGANALRDIMLRGASLADVASELAILWAFIAAFFGLATLSFNRRHS
jgi:ABC-2 type transport system permease protein